MNYIYELNSFWKFIDTSPLDGYTILLYLAILHFHNNSGWDKTITIGNKRLEDIMGVSEKTLIKHRNILIDVGLLLYSSRQKAKQSGKYTLLSFQRGEVGHVKSTGQTAVISTADGKADIETTGKFTGDSTSEHSVDSSDLYKQDETKCIINIQKNDNEEFDFLLTKCQQYNIEINDKTNNWLQKLIKIYDVEWIPIAIEEAAKKNQSSKKYIEGILVNWQRDGKVTRSNNYKVISEKNSSFKKTKFHNFKQRSDIYTEEELENIAFKKRKDYLNKLKTSKDDSDKDEFPILN